MCVGIGHVPQLGEAEHVGGGDGHAVWAQDRAGDRLRRDKHPEQAAGGGLPDARCVVLGGAHHVPSVGAELGYAHDAGVASLHGQRRLSTARPATHC